MMKRLLLSLLFIPLMTLTTTGCLKSLLRPVGVDQPSTQNEQMSAGDVGNLIAPQPDKQPMQQQQCSPDCKNVELRMNIALDALNQYLKLQSSAATATTTESAVRYKALSTVTSEINSTTASTIDSKSIIFLLAQLQLDLSNICACPEQKAAIAEKMRDLMQNFVNIMAVRCTEKVGTAFAIYERIKPFLTYPDPVVMQLASLFAVFACGEGEKVDFCNVENLINEEEKPPVEVVACPEELQNNINAVYEAMNVAKDPADVLGKIYYEFIKGGLCTNCKNPFTQEFISLYVNKVVLGGDSKYSYALAKYCGVSDIKAIRELLVNFGRFDFMEDKDVIRFFCNYNICLQDGDPASVVSPEIFIRDGGKTTVIVDPIDF